MNITVSQVIWYVRDIVDANNPAGGDGRSNNAFDTLAAAETPSGTGHFIFVFAGNTPTTPFAAGIVLKDGQKLHGEGIGLSVPGFTGLVAAGTQPRINVAAGDAVSVPATAGNRNLVEIRGLDLQAAQNAVDVTATGANAVGVTISNNTVRSAGQEGFDLNAGSTGLFTASVQTNTFIASTGNGIDARTSAATTLQVNISGNTVTSNANGILVDGSVGGATTTVTGFATNVVTGNTLGSGIVVTSATFDATPTGTFQTVVAGNTTIGALGNGVGASGLVLTNVAGDLSFANLVVFADNGAALSANGLVAYTGSAGFQLVVGAASTLAATGGPAANLNLITANLPFQQLTSTNSTTTGVSLTNVLGPFSAPAGSITNASGTDFAINGGNANVTYGGIITDDLGALVTIANTTGGVKTFSGAITDGNDGDGSGISLTTNTGATINFQGGLLLSTGANAAFTATGGGTINVCDENPCNPAATGALINTLTTTTGTALNVANSTIGANNLEFRSISANGAPSGIVLNNTGSSGGLRVTGDGTGAQNGSGGTIQNSTGTAVSLASTRNVSLTQINITNGNLHGVGISSVTNFTYQDALLVSVGDGNEDQGITILNLFGTSLIEDLTMDDITEDGIQIRQNATDDGIADTITIRRLNIQDHVAGFGESGVEVQPDLASNLNVLVDDSDFAINTNAIMGVAMSTAATHTGTFSTTVQNSTFNCANAFGSGSIQALGGGSGTINYIVIGNTVNSTKFDGIRVNNDGAATTTTTISNNVITGSGATNNGEGITLRQDENGVLNATITGNNISQIKANGIHLQASDNTIEDAALELRAVVTNNTAVVRSDGFGAGILVDVGDGSGVARNDACVDVSGNVLSGTEMATFFDFDITFQLNETANASLRVNQTQVGLSTANNGASVSTFANPPNTINFGAGPCP